MADEHENEMGTALLAARTAGGSDAAAVIREARMATIPDELNPETLIGTHVPEDTRYEVVDLERYLRAPRRRRGSYSVATVDALVAYVEAHKDEKQTTVWVHPTSGQVVAVLNDSSLEQPGWGDHKATLDLLVTDEWKHWIRLDGDLVSQAEFAEHIEDGAAEVKEPSAADMLELAQSFHATTNASFRSGTRLSDGEIQFAYDEEVQATAGRSASMQVPQTFELSVRPFEGEDPVPVVARLRYRVAGGNLRIGYKLDRPQDVVRGVLDRIASRLNDELPNVYLGSPPA